jgi:hypothetical protein
MAKIGPVPLGAHGVNGGGRGPDEDEPALLNQVGESGVLRQKPITGVDGLK